MVIENIAGIESNANIISELSINTKINNKGVAYNNPLILTKNFSSCNSFVTGIKCSIIFKTLLFEKSASSYLFNNIFRPLQNKKKPKIYKTQLNVLIIATPKKIKTNRNITAPMIP